MYLAGKTEEGRYFLDFSGARDEKNRYMAYCQDGWTWIASRGDSDDSKEVIFQKFRIA